MALAFGVIPFFSVESISTRHSLAFGVAYFLSVESLGPDTVLAFDVFLLGISFCGASRPDTSLAFGVVTTFFRWSLLIRYSLVLLRSGESLDPTLLWPSALSHSVEPLLSRHVLGFWRCQNFLSVESFDPIHFSLASFGGSLDPTLLWPSALSDSFLWNLSSRQINSFGPLDHKALTFDVVLVVISFG